jgi:succinyl-diaminopimelate desuccinylase
MKRDLLPTASSKSLISWCVVGEPSSYQHIGDVIRVGRRGSLCAKLIIFGVQGHVAYPELADNPIHRFAPVLKELTEAVWDQGNAYFPPTRLQVSNLVAGSGAENIIPDRLEVQFNLRFSTELNETTIKTRVENLLHAHNLRFDLQWRLSGQPFLTQKGELIAAVHSAVRSICGIEPKEDTGGGTSDGRFVAPTGAQVIELGPLNHSIHKVDEHIGLDELERLSTLYEQILINLLVSTDNEKMV